MASPEEKEAWTLDQLAKSEFFHQKLHELGMLEIAYRIEGIKGEDLDWPRADLGISQSAWNKIIHRGIKPVIVFTHPHVLMTIPRSLSYYRMLSMASQKSMKRVGLNGDAYETGRQFTDEEAAQAFAQHLNRIISLIVEADEVVDAREFDLWRGMAAGSQVQGSWQNVKGDKAEILIKGLLRNRLRDRDLVANESENGTTFLLRDGRKVVFGTEPDIGIYGSKDEILAAIEIKGGLDPAGVLERIGAALKSLSRIKEENPSALTLLILQSISLSKQAENDLETNKQVIDYWFTLEDVSDNEERREEIFRLLAI